ncbi:Uncharacterised protein [uncultured archaeon]|nr:Uncharacterised protein [uncultured archaeon]
MNQEAILAALAASEEEAKSLKEIAQAMGLDISSYINWIRVERRLSSSLRALIKWGWVARVRKQKDGVPRFWYNAYWKTELAKKE